MTTAATETLVELLAQKATAKAVLDKDLTTINREIAAIECVLELLDPADSSDEPTHGATRPDDIRNCQTHLRAAIVMAGKNGGKIRVTQASKVIKASGLSDAEVGSIAATLHNRMTASDEWEYVEPGTFRYTHFKPTLPPETPMPEPIVREFENETRILAISDNRRNGNGKHNQATYPH